MNEHSESFNKETVNIRKPKTQLTELKNTINKLKNTLEWFHSRLDEAEEVIIDLKHRAVELTQTEQQKENLTILARLTI